MKNRRTARLVSRKMSENVFNDYYNYIESVNLEYEALRSCGKIAALVCFFLLFKRVKVEKMEAFCDVCKTL